MPQKNHRWHQHENRNHTRDLMSEAFDYVSSEEVSEASPNTKANE